MRTWTTAHLPEREQYAYWREVLCEAFTALDPVVAAPRRSQGGFHSQVASSDFLDITVSHLQSRLQTVVRGPHEIRRTPSEYFFANLQLAGRCIVRQDGREVVACAGDLYVVDTTRPYELDQVEDDWQSVSCRVARDRLLPLIRSSHASTAIRLNARDGIGRVAADFVRSLHTCPEDVGAGSQGILASNFTSLLAAALGATVETQQRDAESIRRELHAAILRHIEENIADAGLGVQSVAARFRISERYLHKVFEGRDSTFAQFVQRSRLACCADELARSGPGRSLAWTAHRWGFGDISHFGRLFKRRYGVAPGAYAQQQTQEAQELRPG
ncbi:helix-turn-helix domain-containing protein [soil metagenome]